MNPGAEGGRVRVRGSEVKSVYYFSKGPGLGFQDSQLPVTPAGSKGTFTFAQIHIYINNNKC